MVVLPLVLVLNRPAVVNLAEGVPCRSGADRERDSHSLGRAWSWNAVSAMVLNPKHMGAQAYGRYRKVERLRRVEDPAAGQVTREVPSGPDEVVKARAWWTPSLAWKHSWRLSPRSARRGPDRARPPLRLNWAVRSFPLRT